MRINPRIIILPFMAVFEAMLLVICFLLAFVSPRLGLIIINWARSLPEIDWYT